MWFDYAFVFFTLEQTVRCRHWENVFLVYFLVIFIWPYFAASASENLKRDFKGPLLIPLFKFSMLFRLLFFHVTFLSIWLFCRGYTYARSFHLLIRKRRYLTCRHQCTNNMVLRKSLKVLWKNILWRDQWLYIKMKLLEKVVRDVRFAQLLITWQLWWGDHMQMFLVQLDDGMLKVRALLRGPFVFVEDFHGLLKKTFFPEFSILVEPLFSSFSVALEHIDRFVHLRWNRVWNIPINAWFVFMD